MIKRILSTVVSVLFIIGLLSACGSNAGVNGEVNIYMWTEYIPETIIWDFEDETGIRVNMISYSSNEDMLNRVRTDSPGTFDICGPSDYMVEYMIRQDMLEPIDYSKINYFGNIGEDFKNPAYDPGNKYSIPYLGGAVGIGVNRSIIKDPINSYKDLFNPKFENQICVLDDFRAVIGITALSMDYSMSETDDAILEEISNRLMELKPLIKAFDSDNPKDLLITGSVPIAVSWASEISYANADNPNIELIYPDDGTYLFMDNFVIPKGAKNYDNAHKFIDYMLRADISLRVSEEYPYVNPNVEAVKLLPEYLADDPASNLPPEVYEKGEYIKDIGDKIIVYDKMWTDLKG
jgi:spermidine/putrescine-binding protein